MRAVCGVARIRGVEVDAGISGHEPSHVSEEVPHRRGVLCFSLFAGLGPGRGGFRSGVATSCQARATDGFE